MKHHADGHIQTADEIWRDIATVDRIEAALAHDALVAFTPADARASRIEREDDEAMWDARLAAGPDVADDQADGATGDEEDPDAFVCEQGHRTGYGEFVDGRKRCGTCGQSPLPYEE